MMDYADIFQSLLILQEENYPTAYDPAPLELIQRLNIAFWPITSDRSLRLELIGEVVGRVILSTYDLTVGEAHALLKLLDQHHFIAAMKQEV